MNQPGQNVSSPANHDQSREDPLQRRPPAAGISRRQFLSGLGTAALAGWGGRPALGAPQAGSDALADQQVLRVGISRNLVNGELDPWYCHSSLQVWEPLIGLDQALRPVPVLAEGWETSADGLTWTLALRAGVTFSDGTPFDAAAVLANWAHMRQVSGRPSSFFGLDFEAVYGHPEDLVALDEGTVQIRLPEPVPALANSIANFYSAMFAPSCFAENGDFATFPIGTGPFILAEWERDRGLVLDRNSTYWDGAPILEQVTCQILPDPNVRVSALRAGEVDALVELGPMLPAQAAELAGDPSYVIKGAPSSCSVSLTFNGFRPPFDDLRMRKAVDLALDRETIVRDLVFGYGDPAQGIISSYAEDVRSQAPQAQVTYDPESAVALANEVLDGRREPVVLLFSPPVGGSFARPLPQIAAFLQATLAPLGLDIELRQLEAAAAGDAAQAGDFHLRFGGPGCFTSGDPDYILRRIMSSTSTLNLEGEGNGGYSNPEADRLLALARTTLDDTERRALYDELQALAVQEVPLCLIYDEQQIIGHRADVIGLEQRITYQPTFASTYIRSE